MTTIYLVRHGKASHDGPEYDVLKDIGAEQARRAARVLLDQRAPLRACLYGPLRRQVDTLVHMRDEARRRGVSWPEGQSFDALREAPLDDIARKWLPRNLIQDSSLWPFFRLLQNLDDGLEANVALTPLLIELHRRWRSGAFDAQGFETYAAFFDRMRAVMDRLEGEARGGDVLVVTSAGVLYWIVKFVTWGPDAEHVIDDTRFANASITVLELQEGRFSVARTNDVRHLQGEGMVSYI